MDNTLFKQIINQANDYEDGEIGIYNCVERYCEDTGISGKIGEKALKWYLDEQALLAGIPFSVVEGKTNLRDHFSQEYIDEMCQIKPSI